MNAWKRITSLANITWYAQCHIVLRESQISSQNYFSSSPKEQPWILSSQIKTESLAYKRNFGLTKWRAPLLVKTHVTWSAYVFSILGCHYWISFRQWINVIIWTTDVQFTYLKVVFVLPLGEIVKIQWGRSSTPESFQRKSATWGVRGSIYIQKITCDPLRANHKAEFSQYFPPTNRTSNQNAFAANSIFSLSEAPLTSSGAFKWIVISS